MPQAVRPTISILRAALLAALAALLTACLFAGEEGGERVIGLSAGGVATDRARLARGIFHHDFENLRDPDRGVPLPESADLDRDGWPDFWEPVLAVGFPEYLINSISIVPDRGGFLAGAYRDSDNHSLHMAFDGTQVGARTRVPVPIDPSLAYELTLRERDSGLWGARIRAGIEWIRTDDAVTEYLRRDEIQGLRPGQIDWAVQPRRLLVNDPPPTANAARLFIILEREPDAIDVSRHGEAWFDDIRLRTLPKVVMTPVEATAAGGAPAIDIEYSGLIDNIPDPANPEFFKGKRYSRRIVVTDVFNRQIGSQNTAPRPLEASGEDRARERVTIPGGRFGVYYLNLRIYDAADRLAADLTRALAIQRPPRPRDSLETRSGKPTFGIGAGPPPLEVLSSPGFLRRALEGVGARQVKIVPWLPGYDQAKDGQSYYGLLAEEIRRLRSSGIRVAGVIAPPSAMFDGADLATATEEKIDGLATILGEAGRRLGLFVDAWQWGADGDDSLRNRIAPEALSRLNGVLAEFAGGLPMAWNLRLDRQSDGQSPDGFGIVDGYVPDSEPPDWIWPAASRPFPWLFGPFAVARGATYPPPELNRLAPAAPADSVEANAREAARRGVWLTLTPPAVAPSGADAASERVQLEQIMTRAVYAAALAPETVFLGELFEPDRGFLRRESFAAMPNLASIARPAYLAAPVLADMLEGADYLGRLGLLPPFEAHVFRRPASDQAVIVLWHNGPDGIKNLDRSEIANGPPLAMTDWAGNQESLPSAIPVRRTPLFITGMGAPMALTRMSVRIAPEPPVTARDRRQSQLLEVVNHMGSQAPVRFRLRYAARLADGGMENGWAVNPEELRANLAPASAAFTPARLPFTASPDPNSPIQRAGRTAADKSGAKLAQVKMTLSTSPPADITLFLGFSLRSDLDVDIAELVRNDDPRFATLQLKVRWFPSGNERRRNEIRLMPFYLRKGEMKETAALPLTVQAAPEEERGRPEARYETVELRIPRNPPRQTWVGLSEEGGSNFYLADVSEFLAP